MPGSPDSDYVTEEVPTPIISDEIWKLILDRSKTPEALVHMLKGEVWVVKRNNAGRLVGTWQPRGEPQMNDKGVRFFTPFLYSTSSPDKLTTYLTEEEVNRLVREMMETVVQVIWERGDEFGIAASNRSHVCRLLEQNYFIGLTSSRKGTILQALKPAYERKEIYTPAPSRSKLKLPGFLGGGR